jgi:hypothetical protein
MSLADLQAAIDAALSGAASPSATEPRPGTSAGAPAATPAASGATELDPFSVLPAPLAPDPFDVLGARLGAVEQSLRPAERPQARGFTPPPPEALGFNPEDPQDKVSYILASKTAELEHELRAMREDLQRRQAMDEQRQQQQHLEAEWWSYEAHAASYVGSVLTAAKAEASAEVKAQLANQVASQMWQGVDPRSATEFVVRPWLPVLQRQAQAAPQMAPQSVHNPAAMANIAGQSSGPMTLDKALASASISDIEALLSQRSYARN